MTVSAIVKFAPIYSAERYKNPDWERPGRDFYWNGSLVLAHPSKTPVIINHDATRQVGFVRTLTVLDEADGPWIGAHLTVETPPSWLNTTTGVSFGRITLHAAPMGEDAYRVCRGLIKEISLLGPGHRPLEPRARVLWIGEPVIRRTPAPIVRKPSPIDPEYEQELRAAQESAAARGLLFRPAIGTVTGVR